MNRLTLQHGSIITLATLALSPCGFAQSAGRALGLLAQGSLSGVIRDADGMPQMGALVEALLPDASLAASAMTDARGHYRLSLQPGSYRIRATAALLLPAIHDRLNITRGGRSVVDMTLSTFLAPGGWLSVARRSSSEPNDDWMWTLRSSASRSILRLTDAGADATGLGAVSVSSSRDGNDHDRTSGRVTLKDSDGGFSSGGSHNILVLTRVSSNGSAAIFRADLSGTRSPYPVAPSAEISVGMQRRTPLNGTVRTVLNYSSHPELLDSRGTTGMQGATLRSAERIELGDLVRVDVGSVLRNSNFGGNALHLEPFLQVAAHAGSDVVLAYSMTHARGTETLEDLDQVQTALPLATYKQGRLRFTTGSHHAISAKGKVPGGGLAEIALYHDSLQDPTIAGSGTLAPADLRVDGLIADPTTRTYRIMAAGYTAAGIRMAYRQTLTETLHAGVEFSTGEALFAGRLQPGSMAEVLRSLTPETSYVASAYVDGKVRVTGTALRASYRLQPARTLTAVDSYRAGENGAFLSCSIRQSLAGMRFLPHGLEALVDVQNLLAQGYVPFVSSDGRTLYLAQTPRTLTAGLSFSF
ncbi:MAG: carboxypeptidase-like regulatory domain-containing protein [Janthinobacterium lividum]